MSARFDAAALARDIVVRHREPGYVRFQLPAPLCAGVPAQAIVAALHQLPGVWRVRLHERDGKLAVSYDAFTCPLASVARALLAAVRDGAAVVAAASTDASATQTPGAAAMAAARGLLDRFGLAPRREPAPTGDAVARGNAIVPAAANERLSAVRGWWQKQSSALRDKTLEWRAQGRLVAQLVKAQSAAQPLLRNAFSERALVNFFNDVVAFYLIKSHWNQITGRWMKSPWVHRNEWFAAFYLIFLLVRYRKRISQPALPAPTER